MASSERSRSRARRLAGWVGLALLALVGVWARPVPSRATSVRTDARVEERGERSELLRPAEPGLPSSSAASERERAETGAGAGGAGELEVRVLAGAKRLLAPEVDVWYADWGRVEPSPELSDAWAGLEQELAVLGEHRSSDARGVARFPRPLGRAVLAARRGDEFAALHLLPAEPGPVELVLAPDPPLFVRVRDTGGRPLADVLVGLGFPFPGGLVCARTGPDGLAELRAGESRAGFLEFGALVMLAVPLGTLVSAKVDLAHPPALPLELTMPPYGAVEVALQDDLGQPWIQPARVWLRPIPEPNDWSSQAFSERPQWTRDGRASFDFVGLGVRLRVAAETDEREEGRVELLAGPRRAGERVQARVAFGQALPVLSARIVEPGGRPIASARLTLGVHAAEGWNEYECASGPEGRFRCALEVEESLSDSTELALESRAPGQPARHALLAIPEQGWGDGELGDVVLAASPLVVRGRLVDEAHAPVVGARVQLELFGLGSSGLHGTETLEPDALGRFEYAAPLSGKTLGVRVEADGFLPHERETVPFGTAGLVIVLKRGGSLAGEFLLPGPVTPVFELFREDELVSASPDSISEDAGRFTFTGLPPGTYTLACGFPGNAARVRVDGLVVRAGQRTQDARLLPLDLRGLLPRVTIEVLDENGQEVPEPTFFLTSPGSTDLVDARAERVGSRWILLAEPWAQIVRVEAPGFRTVELDPLRPENRVVLAPGLPVHLALVGRLPELPAGWELGGELLSRTFGRARAGEARSNRTRVPIFAFDGDAAQLRLSEPGSYLFTFQLRRPGLGASASASFWDEPQSILEVRDDGTLQLFEVPAPSPASVQEMLDFVARAR